MSSTQLEIQLIAAVTAVACALPGVFLVLRRLSMISDAISHTVLLGIVLAFFITLDIHSPWLIVGAALMGVATVSLVELLLKTGRVAEDTAIGLVFPALFSIAVILVSLYLRNVHLDVDAVIRGNVGLALFDRITIGDRDIGPQALYQMLAVLVVNVGFIAFFYKELKLATFDRALAAAMGFAPGLLHYGLMTLVSVTAVTAFDVAGSVLIVGFMIGPAATAYLLTDRLSRMLLASAGIAVVSAVGGCWLASELGARSYAGGIAAMQAVLFGLVWIFAPHYGLIAAGLRRLRQHWEFAQAMLTIHLFNHEGLPEAERESARAQLHEHLQWRPEFVDRVVRLALREGLVEERAAHLHLTEAGRQLARQTIVM